MRCALSWSFQKPGSFIVCSSSACRIVRRSGSKVITDPVELDPDLLELLPESCGVECHAGRKRSGRYAPWQRLNFLPEPHQHGSLRPSCCSADLWTVEIDPVGPSASAAAVAPAAPAIAWAPDLR